MTTLVFTAPGWPWIAAGALVTAALLATIEWRRSAPRRPLRAALIVVAALALGAIGMRPARSRAISDLTSIVLAAPAGDAVAPAGADAALPIAESLGAALVLRDTVPDVAWLRRHHPGLDTLHVVGSGLDAADRTAARGLVVYVHANAPGRGLTQLAWTRAASLGQPVLVAGRIASAPATLVRLEAPGGTADSTRTDSLGGFAFEVLPRAAGPHLYVMTARADGAAVAETLGVSVEPRRLPRVLVLETAPSFETRHLKTWLGERGGEVAVRSLVARDAYRYEYLNRSELPLRRLTTAAVSAFDVVVTDGRTLASLSSAERAALKIAIADSGRGLLLRADDVVLGGSGPLPDRDFFVAAPAARLAGPAERSSRLTWASRPVPVASWSLQDRFATRSVARTPDGSDVARVAPRGMGRVAITLVREPGRWLLAGDDAAFGEYWTRLLTPLTEGVRLPRWEVAGAGPAVTDAAVDLVLVAGDSATRTIITGPDGVSDTVYLSRDPVEPERRRAAWWPREAGWHRIEGGGATLDLHVVGGSSGELATARRIAATRRTAVGNVVRSGRPGDRPTGYPAGGDAIGGPAARVLRPVDPLPAFVVFVIALAALWLIGGPRGAVAISAPAAVSSSVIPPKNRHRARRGPRRAR